MSFAFNPFTGNFDVVGTGGPGAGLTPVTDTVLAGQTKVVDSVALTSFSCLFYDFCFLGSTQVRSFRLNVINENGSISDQLFSRIGGLSLQVGANAVGLNLEIEIVNPNGFDIDLSFYKLTA